MSIPILKIYDENHNPIPIPAIRGEKGEKGEKGDKGDKGDSGGITVKGYYVTLSALEQAVTSPGEGDTYGVGSSAPYSIYIWDAVNDEWVNNGYLQGAKGDKGDTGEQGEKGDTGDTGAKGDKGDKGDTGEQGEKGDKGDSGVYVGSGTIPEGYNVKINPSGTAAEFVEEAPNDGKQYARQDGEWEEIAGGGESNPWAGKKVLVIGDSISDPPYGDTPWQTTFASRLGCTVTSHAKAGATLHDMIDGNQTLGFSALSQSDVAGKDLIILFGGANDFILNNTPFGNVGDQTGSNTICGNIYYVISRIYALLTQAGNSGCKIITVGPYCIAGISLSIGDGYEIDEERGAQAMEDESHYLSIPCLNLYKTSGINEFTWGMYTHLNDSTGQSAGDGLHLKSAGNALIGKQIADFVKREVSV